MDLVAVREELAETVRAATALPVFELPSGQLTAPAVLMGAPSGFYDETTDGAMRVEWPLVAIVTRSHPDALTDLAAMVGTEDQRSIPVAINGVDPVSCSWWRPMRWDAWTDLEVSPGVSFWSAQISVEVHG